MNGYGKFTDCCGGAAYPPDIDGAWLRNFIDIGRLEDFFYDSASFDFGHHYKRSVDSRNESVKNLDLRGSSITPKEVSDLTMLKDLKHLTINVRDRDDAEAMRSALLELFAQLPQLQTIEMDGEHVRRP